MDTLRLVPASIHRDIMVGCEVAVPPTIKVSDVLRLSTFSPSSQELIVSETKVSYCSIRLYLACELKSNLASG